MFQLKDKECQNWFKMHVKTMQSSDTCRLEDVC